MVMDVTLAMDPVCIGPYVMSHMHSYSYDHTILQDNSDDMYHAWLTHLVFIVDGGSFLYQHTSHIQMSKCGSKTKSSAPILD